MDLCYQGKAAATFSDDGKGKKCWQKGSAGAMDADWDADWMAVTGRYMPNVG